MNESSSVSLNPSGETIHAEESMTSFSANYKLPPNSIAINQDGKTIVRKKLSTDERSNPNTKYGCTLGYVINGSYVSKENYSQKNNFESSPKVSYAAIVLALICSLHTFFLLAAKFPYKMAKQIYVLAVIIFLYDNPAQRDIKRYYEESYLSVVFPNTPLSKNKVSELYKNIGMKIDECKAYNEAVLETIPGSSILYNDGTIMHYNSNSFLSKASFKSNNLQDRVVNIINTYSPDTDEMLSSIYPGSYSDISVYKAHIVSTGIYNGIVFGDLAFASSIVEQLKSEDQKFSELSYIGLLKSNDTRIEQNKLLDYQGSFNSERGEILYGKKYDEESKKYYYTFKNLDIASRKEKTFSKNHRDDSNFNEVYDKMRDKFGVIILESPIDFNPEELYSIVINRWSIETIFYQQKHFLNLSCIRVQGYREVIGQNFVRSISTSIFLKVRSYVKSLGLLAHSTFSSIIGRLKSIWRFISEYEREKVKNDIRWFSTDEGMPIIGDNSWSYLLKKDAGLLETLKIAKPNPTINTGIKDKKSDNNKNKSKSNKNSKKNSFDILIQKMISELSDTIVKINNIVSKKFSSILAKENKTEILDENKIENKSRGRHPGTLNKKTYQRISLVKKICESLKNIANEISAINGYFEELKKLLSPIKNNSVNKNTDQIQTVDYENSAVKSDSDVQSFTDNNKDEDNPKKTRLFVYVCESKDFLDTF